MSKIAARSIFTLSRDILAPPICLNVIVSLSAVQICHCSRQPRPLMKLKVASQIPPCCGRNCENCKFSILASYCKLNLINWKYNLILSLQLLGQLLNLVYKLIQSSYAKEYSTFPRLTCSKLSGLVTILQNSSLTCKTNLIYLI